MKAKKQLTEFERGFFIATISIKLILIFLCLIFLLGGVSAFDFDNSIKYSNKDLKVDFENVFGLGKHLGTAELKSHKSVTEIKKVGLGNQVTMYYDFNFKELYENGLGKVYFTDQRTGNEIERDYRFVYWGKEEYESPIYEKVCSFNKLNNSNECHNKKIGTETKTREKWLHYNSKDIPKGNVRIGIEVEVLKNDYVDGVWEIVGKEVTKHAEWSEDIRSGVVIAWNLDETSGTTADDLSPNGYNGTANTDAVFTTSINGVIDTCADFSAGNNYILRTETEGVQALDSHARTLCFAGNVSSFSANGMFFNSDESELAISAGSNSYSIQFGANTNANPDAGRKGFSTAGMNNNQWYHYCVTINASNKIIAVYVNGSSKALTVDNSWGLDTGTVVGARNNGTEIFLDGMVDELIVWNRSLNSTEVLEVYNNLLAGDGITYGVSGSLEITLLYPTNDSVITGSSQYFNATYNISTNSFNWTNATYKIWYSNGTAFNTTHTEIITGTQNSTNISFSDISLGEYQWNVYACYENSTFSNCTYANNGNFTFTRGGNFTNYVYNSSILETARGYFSIDLEVPTDTSIQASSGKLIYNGTSYSSVTVTNNGDNNYTISKRIYIPSRTTGFDTENRTFFFNITVVDSVTGETFVQSSDTQTHKINELYFGLCDSITYLVPVLNFTMRDEANGNIINASANLTTFEATFMVGANSNYLTKNYSMSNQSVKNSTFDFCTANYTNSFFTDMETFYTAQNYTDKQYFLNNATLTNTTNEINLYLLAEDNALEFFISVEQDLDPVTNATINIEKYFIGEGVYKTVEIDETDTDGEFTAYLDLDKKYRFTITKDGSVLGIVNKRASCDAAPCEMTLSLTSSTSNPFSNFDTAFASNVLYNLSFNPLTKIITFDFVDSTGLATYFRMVVYNSKTNQSSIILYDNIVYASSGSMTFNVTNYTGDFYVQTYISRSPEKLIDFITFVINQTVETLGLIGLFTSLILLLVIIFGLSFKPSMLVMAVPLALTILKIATLISLSATSLVFIYVLAFIALIALSK